MEKGIIMGDSFMDLYRKRFLKKDLEDDFDEFDDDED